MTIPFRYEPARSALVVIDVQNDFCHPGGALHRIGKDLAAVIEMVPRLELLIESARAAEVVVVFVRTTHDAHTDSIPWVNRLAMRIGDAATPRTCQTGTWGAEFYRVSPLPTELVVTKHRYSAFAGTELDQSLRGLGVESLLFAGVATDVCVESTLRDGLFADYYVAMVEDCCASYSEGSHVNSVRGVRAAFGTIAMSSELSSFWQLSE